VRHIQKITGTTGLRRVRTTFTLSSFFYLDFSAGDCTCEFPTQKIDTATLLKKLEKLPQAYLFKIYNYAKVYAYKFKFRVFDSVATDMVNVNMPGVGGGQVAWPVAMPGTMYCYVYHDRYSEFAAITADHTPDPPVPLASRRCSNRRPVGFFYRLKHKEYQPTDGLIRSLQDDWSKAVQKGAAARLDQGPVLSYSKEGTEFVVQIPNYLRNKNSSEMTRIQIEVRMTIYVTFSGAKHSLK